MTRGRFAIKVFMPIIARNYEARLTPIPPNNSETLSLQQRPRWPGEGYRHLAEKKRLLLHLFSVSHCSWSKWFGRWFRTCPGKSFGQEDFEVIRPLFAEVPVNEQPAGQNTTEKTQEKRCTVHSSAEVAGALPYSSRKKNTPTSYKSRGAVSTAVDNMDIYGKQGLIGGSSLSVFMETVSCMCRNTCTYKNGNPNGCLHYEHRQ